MNLKELARKLDLSPTTVSRALNGYPEVNEATRERVAAAARRYNYKPNTRAIRLATGRAMAVGHVIPVAAQLSASHKRWWIAVVGSMRQLSRAQTREAVEQSVYVLLENINEFDRLSY